MDMCRLVVFLSKCQAKRDMTLTEMREETSGQLVTLHPKDILYLLYHNIINDIFKKKDQLNISKFLFDTGLRDK